MKINKNNKISKQRQWIRTSEVDNGSPGLVVLGDLTEDLEGADLALDVVCLQEVDEQVQPTGVPDGQLAAIQTQVQIQEGAEGYHCRCLVASLEGGGGGVAAMINGRKGPKSARR